MKVAYVFPGQGAQWVGMGRDLYDNFDAARAVFEQADGALGFSLSRLCFEGPEAKLRQTVNAQPAIVTVSFACLKATIAAAGSNGIPSPTFVAGHSLGEYTALAAAGVVDAATAISLVRERGRLMHQAALKEPGGMLAVIGPDEAVANEVCAETGVLIANINCPGQIVLSGPKAALAKAAALAESKGAYRVITLQVSGAFHTPLMQPAVAGMSRAIAAASLAQPLVPIVANTTAGEITTVPEIIKELLAQLCNGVLWQRSVEYMVEKGVTTFVEIGPGKVHSGLIRRINKNVSTMNIGDAGAVNNLVSVG